MSEKIVKRAKVVLKEAKTYTVKGHPKFIKDVPVVIKGEEAIKEFQSNGYFKVTLLSDKVVSKSEGSEKSDKLSGKSSKKLLKKQKKNKKA